MDRVTKENTTLHDVWALMLGAVPGALPVCLCGRSGSGRRTLPRMAASAGAVRALYTLLLPLKHSGPVGCRALSRPRWAATSKQ